MHCNAVDSYYTLETARFKSGPGTIEMETLLILNRMPQCMTLLTDGPLFPIPEAQTKLFELCAADIELRKSVIRYDSHPLPPCSLFHLEGCGYILACRMW